MTRALSSGFSRKDTGVRSYVSGGLLASLKKTRRVEHLMPKTLCLGPRAELERPNTAFPRYNGLDMIAHLRGKLLAKHPNQAIVETAGVGYDVTISVPTFSDLPDPGSDVALHIHTHVREDVIALYGFLRPSEKLLFEKLITVSGIGPKLAITILSGMAADEMVGAIRGNDLAKLTRIPGIGKKTAERMVLELRDKLPEPSTASTSIAAPLNATEEDVISALVNLGYQRPVAEKAVAAATKEGPARSFDQLFRTVLGRLSK